MTNTPLNALAVTGSTPTSTLVSARAPGRWLDTALAAAVVLLTAPVYAALLPAGTVTRTPQVGLNGRV
ncbi:MAG: hypothetical protein U1D28_15685, partial [Burkholderiales bacterium]|nr:hypothetical protein [Burkholderiales bacterium]